MKMNIVTGWPPNIEDIKAAVTPAPPAIFTYGDTCYVPSGNTLPDHLIAHEEVHVKQQANPSAWWTKYLSDPAFRLEQELDAYRAQYAFFCETETNREKRHKFLSRIAQDLSSPMYGNCIGYLAARQSIKQTV